MTFKQLLAQHPLTPQHFARYWRQEAAAWRAAAARMFKDDRPEYQAAGRACEARVEFCEAHALAMDAEEWEVA